MFPQYRAKAYIYDGGTQFIFYPVPEAYAFNAIDVWSEIEPVAVVENQDIEFNGAAFLFEKQLVEGPDRHSLK